MGNKFITFGKPDISMAEKNAVMDVLDSGWLSSGPYVRLLEAEFEKHMGDGYAVAVNSCSEALILSLLINDIGQGDEVIVPSLTFCATINAILRVGAEPVFIDVSHSGHLDPDLISSLVTSRTKAIMPVHYAGESCNMDDIHRFAKIFDLKVIEDAAHAWGGHYRWKDGIRRKIGSGSELACFSFYATKNVTCGEGGMIFTNNREIADKLNILRMQGMSHEAWNRYGKEVPTHYTVEVQGHKANLSDIHAAIGYAQLKRWHQIKEKRDVIWEIYEDGFGKKSPDHARHLFTFLSRNQAGLRSFLFDNGIGTGIHFKPCHLEPAYVYLISKDLELPMTELIGSKTVSLPITSEMTAEDAKRVVDLVNEYENKGEDK